MKIIVATDSYKGTINAPDATAIIADALAEKLPLAQILRMPIADGGEGSAASWLNTVSVRSVHPNTTVAFRMNNLSGSAAELKLYAYGADGKLAQVAPELWSITNENGEQAAELTDGELYEVRVTVVDNDVLDLNEAQKEIKLSVVLGK